MRRAFRKDLEIELRDVEFAKEFGSAAAKTDFALTLAKARRTAGVVQHELAGRLGTKQSYIAKLERGDANPTIGRIGELLAVLGLRLSTDVIPLTASVCSKTESRRVDDSGLETVTVPSLVPAAPESGIAARTRWETSNTTLVEALS